MPLYKGQVLQYLFYPPTFGEGPKARAELSAFIADASHASVGSDVDEAFILVDTASGSIGLRHLNECMALSLVRFFAMSTDDALNHAYSLYPQCACANVSSTHFGCELRFGQSENRIYFSKRCWIYLIARRV